MDYVSLIAAALVGRFLAFLKWFDHVGSPWFNNIPTETTTNMNPIVTVSTIHAVMAINS